MGKVDISTADGFDADGKLLTIDHQVYRFRNDDLSGLVSNFAQLGFGFEDETSLAVFLPLSMWGKLPLPWAVFGSFSAEISRIRSDKGKSWKDLSDLFSKNNYLWTQGSSQQPLSQHSFSFLVENIHDVESELWLMKIEGRMEEREARAADEHRNYLTELLRKFPDYEKLLSDIEPLYCHLGRDTRLLSYLKDNQGSPSPSDHEKSNDHGSGGSDDKEIEKARIKDYQEYLKGEAVPTWLRERQPG
ncbi:ankyrin repeat protein [Colletotrichum sojae]|uniref:Ankyrin repeat protein n=1 Tax=Colletotrichum sojae TaxID=2175907 RepID=A0A8H6J921_9PEZI|nr:ankyrin repeat protein [Colletotrichum sojae]